MTELMKKYWFIVLIAVILVGVFGFVVFNETKDNVAGKKVDGQDVVFTIGDQSVTAENLFDMMKEDEDAYIELIAYDFQTDILMQSVDITDEMRTEAEEQISSLLSYFESTYSDDYDAALSQWMTANGFTKESEIINYTLPWTVIRPIVIDEYLEANLETFYNDYAEEYSPRLISHILVSMTDPANPTEEELAKVAEVETALQSDDFATVATNYSDDSGSASSGGLIGIVDSGNAADYVTEFSDAAMKLTTDQVSDWVKTDYGWHLIKCDGSDKDSLIETDSLLTRLEELNVVTLGKVLVEKAESIGYEFADEELKTKVFNYLLGVEDTEESEATE